MSYQTHLTFRIHHPYSERFKSGMLSHAEHGNEGDLEEEAVFNSGKTETAQPRLQQKSAPSLVRFY